MFGENATRPTLGIVSNDQIVTPRMTVAEAFGESLHMSFICAKLTALSIVKMISAVLPASSLGGPISVITMAHDQAVEGIPRLLSFLAFMSINLAIFNLMPIPVLDGGHIVFDTIEICFGKIVSGKILG